MVGSRAIPPCHAVGNRLTETTTKGETAYTYDTANRLTSVNGQAVQWDDNGHEAPLGRRSLLPERGNMLADGTAVYTYNTANKLVGVTKGTSSIVYAYSGLGDRLKQIADGVTTDYTLDINTGLTQVLQDGKQTYLYGNPSAGSGQATRISQIAETQTGYFLPDALGSMRQMTDSSADLTLARAYDPYGNVVSSSGAGETVYGYTGEQQSNGLVHLRARDYASQLGRFTSRDTWEGDDYYPSTYSKWEYVEENPINKYDPSGMYSCENSADSKCLIALEKLYNRASMLKAQVEGFSSSPQYRLQPVEALAQLTAYADEVFDYDNRGMMWGMTKVLVGLDANDYHFISLEPAQNIKYVRSFYKYTGLSNLKSVSHKEDKYFIGQNWLPRRNLLGEYEKGDWRQEYFDNTPNQAFHFWYYAASVYFDGDTVGLILANMANAFHDPYVLEKYCGDDLEKLQDVPILKEWAKNVEGLFKEDYDLGEKGIEFGFFMTKPRFLTMVIGSPDNWIRNNLQIED